MVHCGTKETADLVTFTEEILNEKFIFVQWNFLNRHLKEQESELDDMKVSKSAVVKFHIIYLIKDLIKNRIKRSFNFWKFYMILNVSLNVKQLLKEVFS